MTDSNQPVVYDKAKWHSDGDFPKELDSSQSFIHTGFFLGWLIDQQMLDPEFLDDVQGSGSEISRFQSRELTAPKLFELWDGVLSDDMLNDEANAFAQSYFDFEVGDYLADYDRVLAKELPTTYHVEDTWINFDLMSRAISERYTAWQKSR